MGQTCFNPHQSTAVLLVDCFQLAMLASQNWVSPRDLPFDWLWSVDRQAATYFIFGLEVLSKSNSSMGKYFFPGPFREAVKLLFETIIQICDPLRGEQLVSTLLKCISCDKSRLHTVRNKLLIDSFQRASLNSQMEVSLRDRTGFINCRLPLRQKVIYLVHMGEFSSVVTPGVEQESVLWPFWAVVSGFVSE